MNQKLMTLDFWQDTVIYEGKTLPTGTIACEALNVSADTITKKCTNINLLLGLMNAGQNASSVIQIAREAALNMLDILSVTPPFSYMDIVRHRKQIETVFTSESCVRYADCVKQANENLLQLTDVPDYADALTLYRYAAVFGHLAYSLGEYQKAMLDFVRQTPQTAQRKALLRCSEHNFHRISLPLRETHGCPQLTQPFNMYLSFVPAKI